MSNELPNGIITLYSELRDIINESVDKGKCSISMVQGAKLVGMDKDCFRAAAYRGTNPYAIGGRRSADSDGFGVVPILPLYCRMTNISGADLEKMIGG